MSSFSRMTVQSEGVSRAMSLHLRQTCEAGTTKAPPPRKPKMWTRSSVGSRLTGRRWLFKTLSSVTALSSSVVASASYTRVTTCEFIGLLAVVQGTNLVCQHRTRDIPQTDFSCIRQFNIERASENEGQETCLRPVRHRAWKPISLQCGTSCGTHRGLFETKEQRIERRWTCAADVSKWQHRVCVRQTERRKLQDTINTEWELWHVIRFRWFQPNQALVLSLGECVPWSLRVNRVEKRVDARTERVYCPKWW